jgi:hypothetical protein
MITLSDGTIVPIETLNVGSELESSLINTLEDTNILVPPSVFTSLDSTNNYSMDDSFDASGPPPITEEESRKYE